MAFLCSNNGWIGKEFQDSAGSLHPKFTDSRHRGGWGSHTSDQHQWHCWPIHCAPWRGRFSCNVFPDKYCLLSIYTQAEAGGLEPQERGAPVAEWASRGQLNVHAISTFPTINNHNTRSVVGGSVILETLRKVNREIGKLLTNGKKGGKTMKVYFWRVALEQQIKPKIKTKN